MGFRFINGIFKSQGEIILRQYVGKFCTECHKVEYIDYDTKENIVELKVIDSAINTGGLEVGQRIYIYIGAIDVEYCNGNLGIRIEELDYFTE